MFGDVNVKVEDGNLGRSSSTGTGTSIKIGISNVESKSPILISGTMNAKKIKEKVGNTPLADACIDAVEWGASSIYCIPVKAGTAGTIGKITEDKKGYGTFSYNELQKGRHLLSPLPDACDHIHRAERACPYYREWMLHQTC